MLMSMLLQKNTSINIANVAWTLEQFIEKYADTYVKK